MCLTILFHLRIFITMIPILIVYGVSLGIVICISTVPSRLFEMTQSLPSLVLVLSHPENSCSASNLLPLIPHWLIHSGSALGPLLFSSSKKPSPPFGFLCHLQGNDFYICYLWLSPMFLPLAPQFCCLLDIATWVFHQPVKITENVFTIFLSKMASPSHFPISINSARTLVFIP